MSELVVRYCANYGLSPRLVTEEQVRAHLHLERRLTAELVASRPADRWEMFERCYGELYRELPWLNDADPSRPLDDWPALLGAPPRRIYEVGSGQGGLARALVSAGYEVEATEVTRERGGGREERPGLTWSITDGVHLERFAGRAPYDAVISDQVVEHLHPDDLGRHLRGALAILAPGASYVLRTPHAHLGPADISGVFGFDRPVGMHLREYTYGEMADAAHRAGFARVAAPLGLPQRLRRRVALPRLPGARPSGAYLRWLEAVEHLLTPLRPRHRRLALDRVLRAPLFRRDLWIVAIAPGGGERSGARVGHAPGSRVEQEEGSSC
jgi:SAM-dependent methyltransferase